jgi:histidinol-phosphate aminotransferase
VLIGNGSDELIGLLCATFGEPRDARTRGSVLYPSPSFVVYRIAAVAHGLEPLEVPLGPRFAPDEDALLAAVADRQPNLVFLATPNNPTGTVWPRETVTRLVTEHPEVITVVDEAYLAYGDARSCSDLALSHPHCLVLGTLSKIGLAALRVGYLIGRPEVLTEVDKVRPRYNLSAPDQLAAEVVLPSHQAELEGHLDEVRQERARLSASLGQLGIEVFPSGANFLLVKARAATALAAALAVRGVMVRCFDQGALLGCLRITIGTRDENDRLLEELPACLRAASSHL